MSTAAKQTRDNRTITVDFRDEATYVQLLGDGKAFVECVCAFPLPRLSARTQGDLSGRRVPDPPFALPPCPARWGHHLADPVHQVSRGVHRPPPLVLRYRQMRPAVARDALLATHGAQFELCAILWHISPMALSRLVCAFGQHSVVTVLTRCGLPLRRHFIADEKHSRCLTDKVYLPTIVRGRVLWHLGYTEEASAAAFTQSYREFQRAAYQHEPTLGSAASSRMALTARPAVCGRCFRVHALALPAPRAQQAPEETDGDRVASASVAPREVPRPASMARQRKRKVCHRC